MSLAPLGETIPLEKCEIHVNMSCNVAGAGCHSSELHLTACSQAAVPAV